MTTKFLFLVVASINENPTYYITLLIGDFKAEKVYLSAKEASKLKAKLKRGGTHLDPNGDHYVYYY